MHIMETIPRICIHLWFYATVVPATARSFEGHRNQSISDFPKLILDFLIFDLRFEPDLNKIQSLNIEINFQRLPINQLTN